MRRRSDESALVKGIYDGLTLRGRTVLRVGQWRADMAGTDAGCPDLFVWCPRRDGWIGLECKTDHGPLRREQAALLAAGMIVVVRTIEAAFDAVGESRAGLGVPATVTP